jgi:ParB family transcriptional regulator, chromosome partitioning protein
MKSIVPVNPFHCRMWDLHDRVDDYITEQTCKTEIESFTKHGQIVPALGRVLHDDPNHKIELIYGARRLFVARHINVPLLVELRNISDREAIVAMDIENRHRSDISSYERGLSYARWLRTGHFRSQEDIARTLRISASQVSRLLKLAQLPTVIIDAFDSPASICEGWGLDLMEALEDQTRRHATVREARLIAGVSPRLAAREVYRKLLAAAVHGRKFKAQSHDEVVKDESGVPLFRIRYQSKAVAVLLPVEKIAAQSMDRIRVAISDILTQDKRAAAIGGTAGIGERADRARALGDSIMCAK